MMTKSDYIKYINSDDLLFDTSYKEDDFNIEELRKWFIDHYNLVQENAKQAMQQAKQMWELNHHVDYLECTHVNLGSVEINSIEELDQLMNDTSFWTKEVIYEVIENSELIPSKLKSDYDFDNEKQEIINLVKSNMDHLLSIYTDTNKIMLLFDDYDLQDPIDIVKPNELLKYMNEAIDLYIDGCSYEEGLDYLTNIKQVLENDITQDSVQGGQ